MLFEQRKTLMLYVYKHWLFLSNSVRKLLRTETIVLVSVTILESAFWRLLPIFRTSLTSWTTCSEKIWFVMGLKIVSNTLRTLTLRSPVILLRISHRLSTTHSWEGSPRRKGNLRLGTRSFSGLDMIKSSTRMTETIIQTIIRSKKMPRFVSSEGCYYHGPALRC